MAWNGVLSLVKEAGANYIYLHPVRPSNLEKTFPLLFDSPPALTMSGRDDGARLDSGIQCWPSRKRTWAVQACSQMAVRGNQGPASRATSTKSRIPRYVRTSVHFIYSKFNTLILFSPHSQLPPPPGLIVANPSWEEMMMWKRKCTIMWRKKRTFPTARGSETRWKSAAKTSRQT